MAEARYGIVVGVDGSATAHAAIEWAVADALRRDRPLTLVHAVPSPVVVTAPWPEMPLPDEAFRVLDEEGERILAESRQIAERAGAREVATELAHATPVAVLAEMSEHAERLVVGSRGQTALGRLLLGSVSTGLAHAARCPLAIVHDEEPRPADAPVVVGIDGSPASEAATRIAFEEASFRGVELVAVHGWRDVAILDYPGLDVAGLQALAEATLAERLAGWCEQYPDVTVRRVVAGERPARMLIEQAETAQLVVVGSHGRGRIAGALLGSVSTAVMHAVRTPVIIARG
ncbi:universal stress protein [uncultured Mycolicibacterium sp.]|uniref:universal stress protein n=1 Tax=uncultured Mycolicibacterium sp. TaxID=2320817 RepID=UPI00261EF89D|nr:universal stress protein [uncultured Mycolicibacterium sp.]